MTNAQPGDITARLDNIDDQLEQLGDEIDLIRIIQNGNRREIRATSQTAAKLEQTSSRLAAIARDHQIALRIMSQEAERDRASAAIDRQVFQNEIQRIWEYLRDAPRGLAS